jgi:hypothetical protein
MPRPVNFEFFGHRLLLVVLVLVIGIFPVVAQDSLGVVDPSGPISAVTEPAEQDTDTADEEETSKVFEYGSKGLDLRSRDGNYHAHIERRAQMRFTSRDFDDPIAPNPDVRAGNFVVNRARFKLGGHAYRPRLTFDLSRLYDRNEEIGRRWENRIRLQWDVSF